MRSSIATRSQLILNRHRSLRYQFFQSKKNLSIGELRSIDNRQLTKYPAVTWSGKPASVGEN
jgi:hypothetical protein